MSRRSNKRNQRSGNQANRQPNPPVAASTTSEQAPPTAQAVPPKPRRTVRRKRRQINWIAIVGGAGAVVLLGVLVMNLSRQFIRIDGVQSYGPFVANIHVTEPVVYQQTPPTGGAHYASWQNCGIYDRPIQNELAVHSMEHGAVWLTYQPDLPADEVERLKNLVRGRSYTLMSPYAGLPSPIAISAWGLQLTTDRAADPRLEQFVTKHRQGSQTPEPGAACIGGVGAPDER